MLLPDYLTVLKRDPNGPIFCVKLLRFLKRGNLTHKIAAFVVTSRVDAPLDAVRKEGHSQAIQGVGASVLDLLASAHRCRKCSLLKSNFSQMKLFLTSIHT